MPPPIVSYLIAAYNHEAYLQQLLDSLRHQTFAEIEIVIVDDGSSDKTLAVAQDAAEADPRIAVYPQPHSGVVAARNNAVERSSAPFISIVDSDDVLPLNRTKTMVRAIEANPK